ncbi:MAG: hemerythrin family protein [bacterium]
MSVIPVSSIPSVAADFMNDVHLEEVEMINALHDLILENQGGGSNEQEISDALSAVLEHTREHFAREERFMQEGHFPPYSVHKAEHDAFLKDFEEVEKHWLAERDLGAVSLFLEETLPAWLNQHISTMDFVTARFLSR